MLFRSGWLARPYPTRTFTLQEVPSFAWRTSMLSSTTPGKLRFPYHNVNRSIAFWSDNDISLPVFGISELNLFNLSAFSLLPHLPTLNEVSYPTSSKANYGRLVYLTRWDSHPLYFTTLHIRTVRYGVQSHESRVRFRLSQFLNPSLHHIHLYQLSQS